MLLWIGLTMRLGCASEEGPSARGGTDWLVANTLFEVGWLANCASPLRREALRRAQGTTGLVDDRAIGSHLGSE